MEPGPSGVEIVTADILPRLYVWEWQKGDPVVKEFPEGEPARKGAERAVRGGTPRTRLAVKAYYDTSGLLGRLYWYIFLPFHHIIFKGLIRQIEERS